MRTLRQRGPRVADEYTPLGLEKRELQEAIVRLRTLSAAALTLSRALTQASERLVRIERRLAWVEGVRAGNCP